jgi:hypothetical protein
MQVQVSHFHNSCSAFSTLSFPLNTRHSNHSFFHSVFCAKFANESLSLLDTWLIPVLSLFFSFIIQKASLLDKAGQSLLPSPNKQGESPGAYCLEAMV